MDIQKQAIPCFLTLFLPFFFINSIWFSQEKLDLVGLLFSFLSFFVVVVSNKTIRWWLCFQTKYTHYATVETGLNCLAVLSTSHCLACSFTAIAYTRTHAHIHNVIAFYTRMYRNYASHFSFVSCWSSNARLCIYCILCTCRFDSRSVKKHWQNVCSYSFGCCIIILFFRVVFSFLCISISPQTVEPTERLVEFRMSETEMNTDIVLKVNAVCFIRIRFFSVICSLCLGSCIRKRQLLVAERC